MGNLLKSKTVWGRILLALLAAILYLDNGLHDDPETLLPELAWLGGIPGYAAGFAILASIAGVANRWTQEKILANLKK